VDRLIAHPAIQGQEPSGSWRWTRPAPSPVARSWAIASACRTTRSISGVFIPLPSRPAASSEVSRAATSDCARVLDAMGKEVILIETVGGRPGRGSKVCRAWRTTTVGGWWCRGLGDEHPGDQGRHPGGRRSLRREQERPGRGGPHGPGTCASMLELNHVMGQGHRRATRSPIVKCVALPGRKGRRTCGNAIDAHYQFLKSGPGAPAARDTEGQ